MKKVKTVPMAEVVHRCSNRTTTTRKMMMTLSWIQLWMLLQMTCHYCQGFVPLLSPSFYRNSQMISTTTGSSTKRYSSRVWLSVASTSSSTAGNNLPRRSIEEDTNDLNNNNKSNDATLASTEQPLVLIHASTKMDPCSNSSSSSISSFLVTLWQFTRPHTLIGSALAIPALYWLAAPPTTLVSTSMVRSILYAMIPSLFMNLYITGLNQITDVEIDKINKPQLPIPAGRLSMRHANIIVGMALIGSVLLGALQKQSCFLNVALWGSGILGTLYSLPPFRWKRYPILAAMCVVAVRGTIINAAFFAHARTSCFQLPWNVPGMWYSSAFFCVFGMVIAIIKDVPDIVGDQISNIRTFSVRVGAKRMLWIGTRLLEALFYGTGMALIGTATTTTGITTIPPLVRHPWRLATGIAAMLAGLSVRTKASAVDPQSSAQVYEYYMHLWKLFYLAYAALPFVR